MEDVSALRNKVASQIIEEDGLVPILTMLDLPTQKAKLAESIAEFAMRYSKEEDEITRCALLADIWGTLLELIEKEGLSLENIEMVSNFLTQRDGSYSDRVGLVGIYGKRNLSGEA